MSPWAIIQIYEAINTFHILLYFEIHRVLQNFKYYINLEKGQRLAASVALQNLVLYES